MTDQLAPLCSSRPLILLDEALAIGRTHSVKPPFILGIRGFETGKNQTNVYDDAICMVDLITFEAFNGNTDPSKQGRGMATVIAPQVITYKIGIHNLHREKDKQYQALVQASTIRVTREGIGEVPPGWFGINIHRGGRTTCGSEGCQTIPPDQWPGFMQTVWEVLKMRNIFEIPYLLVEQ